MQVNLHDNIHPDVLYTTCILAAPKIIPYISGYGIMVIVRSIPVLL